MVRAGESWCPAEVRALNTLGAELSCRLEGENGPIALWLEDEDFRLELPAEILRRDGDTLFLAFMQLDLESLERLEGLCQGQPRASSPPPAGTNQASAGPRLFLSERWSPPVSEPLPSDFRPSGPLPANATGRVADGWSGLPTRTAAPPRVTPVPAPLPAAGPEARVTGAERRKQPREERAIPVQFDNLTSLIKEFTHNISFGGLFVYTDRAHRLGEDVAVTLIHPVSGERLTLLGRVAHAASAPSADPVSGKARFGVGVQFKLPLEELKRLLSEFIDARQRETAPTDLMLADALRLLELAGKGPRQLLGVDAEADANRIRRAYFELVDRFHPDRYHGKVPPAGQAVLEELFRRLTAAYESLLA